jgi:hypothetical protein
MPASRRRRRPVVTRHRRPVPRIRGTAKRRRRRNPAQLIVFSNPAGKRSKLISKRVEEIRYQHTADGKWYKHPFGPGVCAELLTDGSVRLYHSQGKPLFQWFD